MLNLTRPQRKLWLSAIAFGAISLSAPAFALTDAERQAKLQELRATITEMKQELEKVKSSRADLQNNLEQSETKIGDLSKKVESLKQQLEQKQSHLEQLRSEKEALFSVKKQQQGSAAQHVNAAYRLGQQSHLKMLLNQQDPAAVSRNMKYYNYLMSAQAQKIDGFVTTIERIETLEPEIVDTVSKLNSDQTLLEQKRQQLLEQHQDRQRTLKKLEATIADKDSQLTAMDTDRANLESLLKRVVRVAGGLPEPAADLPFAELKGQLPWPARGKVLRSYGSSRVANKVRWQGILIGADEGAPVFAVHHGRVVFSDYLRGHGLLLIIDHGDGFMSLYAHNKALYKELGDAVSGGEPVAEVGLSGGQSQAGLYFEMRHKGEPTDPHQWLRKSA